MTHHEGRGCYNAALCIVSFGLLWAMLVCASRLPAQETTHKRGAVKGTVAVVNASQERSTPEGLSVQLKPVAEGSVALSAVTDAGGKYEFKDGGGGGYGFWPEGETVGTFETRPPRWGGDAGG